MPCKKRILITGANGLLGRQAVSELYGLYEVHALVHRPPTSPLDEVEYHVVDFSANWSSEILPDNVEVIIHLAQSAHFREFPEKAMDVFCVNVDSTARLLDYARRVQAKRFVYASSGGVYKKGLETLHENSPITSHGELGYYFGSKLCSEILVHSYSPVFDVSILRFFFVYGSGQNRSMLIPRLVDNVKEGRTICLHGRDGIQLNPIHVKDAVKAMVKTFELKGSHTFNVAGPEVVTIREISELIGSKIGKQPNYVYSQDNPQHLVAEIGVMREHLYTPEISIKDGIDDLL